MKRTTVLILMILFVFGFVSCTDSKKEMYNQALDYLDNGNYSEAYELLKELGDYQDSEKLLSNFRYAFVKELSNGEVTKEVVYNKSGFVLKTENYVLEYIYNEEENRVTEIQTHNNGNTNHRKYTPGETEIQMHWIKNGEHVEGIDYEYVCDKNGKIIREIQTKEDGRKAIIEYKPTYIVNHGVINDCDISFEMSNERFEREVIYDENGNVIEIIDWNSFAEYRDIYDEHGNITKSVETFSDGYQSIYENIYEMVYIPYVLSDEAKCIISNRVY